MSQSRSDSGQSMEEILASIRRIIAEGERDVRETGEGRGGPPSAAVGRAPDVSTGTAEAFEADVLVLTEMVRDDGSVVTLPTSEPGAAPEGPGAEGAAASETPGERLPAEPEPEPAAGGQPSIVEPGSGTALAATDRGPPYPPAAEEAAATAPGASPVEVAPSSSPALSASPTEIAPPAEPSKEEERISVSVDGYKKPDLVSEETLAASTAALSQLAQSVGRPREIPPGQSKTVEELVREAVEPMLKQWLDANLSRIVERMVREAIDRVVRRVE